MMSRCLSISKVGHCSTWLRIFFLRTMSWLPACINCRFLRNQMWCMWTLKPLYWKTAWWRPLLTTEFENNYRGDSSIRHNLATKFLDSIYSVDIIRQHAGGVQTRIIHRAQYVHCRPHIFNLYIVHYVPIIRNVMDTMTEVYVSFRTSEAFRASRATVK